MKWVALLRAVNLGGHNKVPMAELRTLLAGNGYEDVRTYIASGNVLLESHAERADVATGLERLIARAFGVTTVAILRTPKELAATIAAHPFGKDTSQSYVAFLAGTPEQSTAARFRKEHGDPARTVLKRADVHLRLVDGVQGAHLSGARLESLLGVRATLRSWRTVAALAERAR